MSETRVVRYVSGGWNPVLGRVCLRLQADTVDEPKEFLFAPEDVQPLVVLLLMLSGEVGARRPPPSEEVEMVPLHLDSVGLGETQDGGIVLRLDIGETALAFAISPGMSQDLGRALMTLGAAANGEPAN
jgi:hypothetical protein